MKKIIALALLIPSVSMADDALERLTKAKAAGLSATVETCSIGGFKTQVSVREGHVNTYISGRDRTKTTVFKRIEHDSAQSLLEAWDKIKVAEEIGVDSYENAGVLRLSHRNGNSTMSLSDRHAIRFAFLKATDSNVNKVSECMTKSLEIKNQLAKAN